MKVKALLIFILLLNCCFILKSASDDSTNIKIFDKEYIKILHSKHNTLFYTSTFDMLQFKTLSLIFERVINYTDLSRSIDYTIGGGVATGIPIFITNSMNIYIGISNAGSDKLFLNLGYIRQFFDEETGIIDVWGYDDFHRIKDLGSYQNQIYIDFGYKYIPGAHESESNYSYTISSLFSMDINQNNGKVTFMPFYMWRGLKPIRGANYFEKGLNSIWQLPLMYIYTTTRFTIGYSW